MGGPPRLKTLLTRVAAWLSVKTAPNLSAGRRHERRGSTWTALLAMAPHLSVGTCLLFDELAAGNHELRVAFERVR